ncbi:hypothetical protein ACI2LF_04040 [Kribbella sp. NPDC020789]
MGTRIGKMTVEAAAVGLAVGILYAALFRLGVPLCAPSAESCAIHRLGPLFGVPLGLIATVLWVLARRVSW